MPKIQMAYEGSNVTLWCYSYWPPVWLKDNRVVRGFMTNEKLLLNGVTQSDSGMYKCEGTYGNRTKFEHVLEVLVGGKS